MLGIDPKDLLQVTAPDDRQPIQALGRCALRRPTPPLA
jgi:hypothetical protein